MAKRHTNLREVLTDLAPVIGSVIGGYSNEDYIADKVLPRVRIESNPDATSFSGNLLRYADDAMFGDTEVNDVVGIGGDAGRVEAGNIVAVPYYATRHMLNSLHDNDLLKNLPLMGEAEQIATLEALCSRTVEVMKIIRETSVAALYQTTANYATTAAAALPWSNELADIIGNIEAMARRIKAVGRKMNALVMSETDMSNLRVAPQLLSFMPTNIDRNIMTQDAASEFLKAKFELDIVQVGSSVRNTSQVEGTLTSAYIWTGGTVWGGHLPTDGQGAAGEIGVPQGERDALMTTPSATYNVRLQDWKSEAIDEDVQPRSGLQFSYREAAGTFMTRLGTTLTSTV